jgi:hypothetical protein
LAVLEFESNELKPAGNAAVEPFEFQQLSTYANTQAPVTASVVRFRIGTAAVGVSENSDEGHDPLQAENVVALKQ